MTARILDGKYISALIKADIRAEIEKLTSGTSPPCLAVVLTSDDPASKLYVRKKQEACAEVGIISYLIRPFESSVDRWHDPMGHLVRTIEYLNKDESVDGILVQLPLAKSSDGRVLLDQKVVFDTIDPIKDVDVFTPENVGLLVQGRPRFVPCTPAGIQMLLVKSGVEISGKKVTIINRSDIVGKPLHALLIQNNHQANATVTVCHDYTPKSLLKEVCLRSDIIVVAVGIPKFLTADMVPEGSVVVDVGINRVEGNKVVGDVDFLPVAEKASAITPVPGGCGPLTVSMLLHNTLIARKMRNF